TSDEMAQLVAVVLTLPLLLITLAKLRRQSALLARMGVRVQGGPRHRARAAAAVARVLFAAASFAMILGVVALSVPALPDLASLGLWLVLLAAAGVLLWRPSLHGYHAARRRLRRTLSTGHDPARDYDLDCESAAPRHG